MEESGVENLGQRRIVRRTNAINRGFNPETKKPEEKKPGGGTMARIAAGGLALGGLAGIINTIDSNTGGQVGIVEAKDKHHESQSGDKTDLPNSENRVESSPDLFDLVFHDLDADQLQKARIWVDDFKEKIASKPGYENEHVKIPEQYKDIIQQTADAYGISFDMLYGIIAIENGGGVDIENKSSGAVGVAQFLPKTARQYGLIVNEKQDQRKDPVLSIDAAGRYLRDHKALLGDDIGLTMWSYHAGIGNVYHALQVYFLDKYGTDIGSYSGAIVANDPEARESVESNALEWIRKDKLDYYKLSSNPAVRSKVISGLDDYSDTYVPSILAIIKLRNEKDNKKDDGAHYDLGGGLKVTVPKNTFPFGR